MAAFRVPQGCVPMIRSPFIFHSRALRRAIADESSHASIPSFNPRKSNLVSAMVEHAAGFASRSVASVQVAVPACFMRGGTSKALVLKEEDLTGFSQDQIDKIILSALGSPDPHGRQIDGLGGGISSLSKCCIVGKAHGEHAKIADVTYRFGQVEVRRAAIDWTAACGNIGSAAAHFAILSGLVDGRGGGGGGGGEGRGGEIVSVTVWDANADKIFRARVPVRDGEPEVRGDAVVPGVPGSGARIEVQYLDPSGTAGKGLFPTGQRAEDIEGVTCSVVDSSLVSVFVDANQVDLAQKRLEFVTAPELDEMQGAMALLERIRRQAAVRAGLAASTESVSVGEPKVVLVGGAGGFVASGGDEVMEQDVDVTLRAVSVGNAHRTIPGTVRPPGPFQVEMHESDLGEVGTALCHVT